MSPYVGMARKQNGGYNASISVQTLIFHLVVNSTRLKTVRSALRHCPNSTVALRLLESVVKVTNLEVVKIEFRHLPFQWESYEREETIIVSRVEEGDGRRMTHGKETVQEINTWISRRRPCTQQQLYTVTIVDLYQS